jgi:predicted metal-dependent phosphoesterase TrpH
MDRIDLHTHSNHSDGSLSPRRLVELARERGLRAIALTDHDTISGVAEAVAAGRELGVEVVPGVEISAQFTPGTMHILGYYISFTQSPLVAALQRLQRARAHRNPKIIDRLLSLGLEITRTEVESLAGGQVGRPHIAQALVNRGYVANLDEAFDLYLKKGAPAYVEKFRFSPRQSIDIIRSAGGLAALAHPYTIGVEDPENLTRLLQELQNAGLEGIEVFYPEHSEEMTAHYREIASELGLLCTGGSDFHGDFKDGSSLGGETTGPFGYNHLQAVKDRLAQREHGGPDGVPKGKAGCHG